MTNTNENTTTTATAEMTKYAKTKLNAKLREYAEKNSAKNALDKECKALSTEIKDEMGAAGLATYTSPEMVATVSVTMRRTLDEAKIKALLGGTIPEDCYKMTESARLTIKAA